MKDYNGFSGEERAKVGALHRKALNEGRLQAPTKCCMCGQTEGVIHLHLEDYSTPFENIYPCCIGCHMRLHIRFDYPNLWKQHLKDLRNGKKSPAYTSTVQFFSNMKKAGIYRDIDFVEPLEDPSTWFEELLLTKININHKPKNEQN